ncbi:hypothetical protein M885DRAFT_454344, partial [Pelagophyceae sp. CCMP2097]
GTLFGAALGSGDGFAEGADVGTIVDTLVGAALGSGDGFAEGAAVGTPIGTLVGAALGKCDGFATLHAVSMDVDLDKSFATSVASQAALRMLVSDAAVCLRSRRPPARSWPPSTPSCPLRLRRPRRLSTSRARSSRAPAAPAHTAAPETGARDPCASPLPCARRPRSQRGPAQWPFHFGRQSGPPTGPSNRSPCFAASWPARAVRERQTGFEHSRGGLAEHSVEIFRNSPIRRDLL